MNYEIIKIWVIKNLKKRGKFLALNRNLYILIFMRKT